MKIKRIFYLIPENNRPTGGILVAYQHCLFLRKQGYEAYPLFKKRFQIDWFDHDLEYKTYSEVRKNITDDDILVGSEVFPYEPFRFKKGKKILFVQGWSTIYNRFYKPSRFFSRFFYYRKRFSHARIKPIDEDKNYLQLGYDYVIVVSEHVKKHLKKIMGIDSTLVVNGIDTNKFIRKENIRKKNRVLCLLRKNTDDIYKIKRIIEDNHVDGVEWRMIKNIPQNELVREYQEADIFLATSYPEGFNLPPLEAMASGCVVVGFTGGGADMYMIDGDTALVAQDGDCNEAAEKLLSILRDPNQKEVIRDNGYRIAIKYNMEFMESNVLNFYRKLDNEK